MQNLLKHCLEPTSFLKPLAKLFSVIKNKQSRQLLCTIFQVCGIPFHLNLLCEWEQGTWVVGRKVKVLFTNVLFSFLLDSFWFWERVKIYYWCCQGKQEKPYFSFASKVLYHFCLLKIYVSSLTWFQWHFSQLNAFDQRHLDDINFDARFSAFQTITSHIKEMQTVDINYLIPVMHNCFYNLEVGFIAKLCQLFSSVLIQLRDLIS